MKSYENHLLKDGFYGLLENRNDAKQFINGLSEAGEMLLFGGGVRSYFENAYQIMPRDFDIVINTQTVDISMFFDDYPYKRNRFGGFKVELDDMLFDIWSISCTWAFRSGKVAFEQPEDLTKTVFLNHDAIVYNLNKCEIYDGGYYQSRQDKILDIVLCENPFPGLNVLRAIILEKKHGYKFSQCLYSYLIDWIKSVEKQKDPLELLLNIQSSHYGYEQLTPDEIYESIRLLIQ